MTLATYRKIRIGITFVTALIFSQSLVFHNFFIPILVLALSSLVLLYLRKKVVGVISDERDYQIGGKSALLALQIVSWIGVIVMFVLYALEDTHPMFMPIAMTLAFTVCALMFTYSIIFTIYNRRGLKDEKQN